MSPVNDNASKLDSGDESDNCDAEFPSEVGREFAPIQTAYLQQLKASHRARARAAMRWRPRFLKALRMSCNWTDSLKAAHVSYNTVKLHARNDPEFAAQLKEAEQEGAELLHSVVWKAAVEGNVEPIYFQGKIVGYIRKYDSRMQIELLRAHMPHLFKTPGVKVPVTNSGDSNNKGVIIDEATRAELVAMRQEALQAMKLQQVSASNEALSGSSNSPAGVQ